MRRFRDYPISRKLILIMVDIALVVLLLASAAFVLTDIVLFRNHIVRDITLRTKIIGLDTAAAILFDARESALQDLSILSTDPYIVAVSLYRADGSLFVRYENKSSKDRVVRHYPARDGYYFDDGCLFISANIMLESTSVGSIFVQYDMSMLTRRIAVFLSVMAIILLIAIAVAFILATFSQRIISRPLQDLTQLVKKVTYEHDYTLRARKWHDDEVGSLTNGLNQMLSVIQARDEALNVHQHHLQEMVRDRTAALEASRDAAIAGAKAKSEFLANMSHELRTPMSAIIGMNELALATDHSPEQHVFLSTIKESAEALLRLLNDILDFSKIESGRFKLEEAPFDFLDTVEAAVATVALGAKKKNIELISRISCQIPRRLLGDSGRLSQVIINLVDNSVKFTDKGEVQVRFDLLGTERGMVEVRGSVRDSGEGISREDQERIFESFTQADGSVSRRHGGTGLGLTISAQLIEMMGGRVWVESPLPKQTASQLGGGPGSIFHFTMRFPQAEVQDSQWDDWDMEKTRKSRILIVDDNASAREAIKDALKSRGITCSGTPDGNSAMKELIKGLESSEPYSLVLMDSEMPGMSGMELASKIRENDAFTKLAIVMISSVPVREKGREWERLGISALLTKPLRQQRLFGIVEDLLELRTAESAEKAVGSPETEKPLPPQPPKPLHILLAEDNLFNQMVATMMLKQWNCKVDVAQNGAEAIEMVFSDSYDLVLMDIQMPEIDGLEATMKIREKESESNRHIPIIALTANAMEGDRRACLEAGMDAYLAKPLYAHELFEIIGRLLNIDPEETHDSSS